MSEPQPQMAGRGISGTRVLSTMLALTLLGTSILAPASAVADVGDQYLPNLPDAGGKKDQYGTQVETTAAAPTTTTTEQPGKGKKDNKAKSSKGSEQSATPTGTPPDQGGGPGTGAVIALSLLGIAFVAAVLWLVSRGRRSLADAEQPEIPRHQPDTPRGEITGDGPSGRR